MLTKPLWFLGTLTLGIVFSSTSGLAAGQDGGPTGTLRYSKEAAVAAQQKSAKSLVERYQAALNNSDFATIRTFFAPDAVAEWNEKQTMVGVDAMREPYEALFKTTKFSTDFQFDAADIYGDVAIVRTHHPVGQVEVTIKTGKKTLDFNREIFVLRRFGPDWKIVLYTFSRQPRQGEQ
ncbi:YybH family protein [Sphingomonas sp. PAMC 26617]|uniref:YybH family protein n=1 Tax=Sphingomonas sp. PAMC 26617 TaxID=1112216 RepID=UPI00030407FB|nr:nuclear transport factor 2 family protein [Sphingomonas sp. PAMC 26617]